MIAVFVYFMAQHGIGAPGCEAHSAIIFGLPDIWSHVLAELLLTSVPAEVLIALPAARGEPVTSPLTKTTLPPLAAATFGTLLMARGESKGVTAKVVPVIAAMTAPRRRTFDFILFLSGSPELHCPVVCCNLLTPHNGKTRKIISFWGN